MCIPSALASTAARLCCIEQKAFYAHYVDFFVAVKQIDAPADADHGVALAAEDVDVLPPAEELFPMESENEMDKFPPAKPR